MAEQTPKEETIMIDVEPTWTDLVPVLCDMLEDPCYSAEAKALARAEIAKMAVVCSRIRAEQKEAEQDEREQVERAKHGYPEDDPIGDCEGEAQMEREAELAWGAERERNADYSSSWDYY
jgi:hypothetical protein